MGIKKNIFYSAFLTSANYIFQFITFPYVSRVLGPDGMGIFNFTQSYVNYFMMFCSLGIINLGIREISKCHTDSERSECFSHLFQLNLLITAVVSSVYLILMYAVPKFYMYHTYFLIGILQVIFNAFSIDWLFKGLEKFKYITLRSLIVRSVYVALVFIFIRTEKDVLTYFILTIFSSVANSIINWRYGLKFVKVKFGRIKESVKKYLKPMFLLGSQALIAFFYVGYNTLFLGFVSTEAEVGYYTIGTKIIIIVLTLFASATSVMLPRMSSLISNNQVLEARKLLSDSFDILFATSLPMVVGLAIFAKPIVYIIAGPEFTPAIPVVALSAPLITILGMSQIIQVQILMPLRMDSAIARSCVWGAVFSIICNFLIVPKIMSVGSMIVWVAAEFIVILRVYFYARKRIGSVFNIGKFLRQLGFYIPAALACYFITLILPSMYLSMAVGAIFLIIYSHLGQMYVFHLESYRSFIGKLTSRIKI